MEPDPDVNGLMANMATTPRDMLVEALHPGIFEKGDDVEAFIIKAARFFDASGTNKTMRGLLVLGLISKELRDKYEATEKSGDKGFENRMRQAFAKPQSFIQTMTEALNYKRRGEDADAYERKIDLMIEKLFQYKWDKEALKKELLTHCCDDRELRREVKMRECESSKQITEVIRKFELVREETEQLDAIRSYRDAVTVRENRRTYQPKYRNEDSKARESKFTDVICWTCNRKGHMSRICSQRRIKKCYECGSEEHLRRDCNKVKCYNCNRLGHIAIECRTNRSDKRETGQDRPMYNTRPVERAPPGTMKGHRDRRLPARHINTMEEEENTAYGVRGDELQWNDERSRRQEKVSRRYDEYRDDHPNDSAPSEAEMIGAIY